MQFCRKIFVTWIWNVLGRFIDKWTDVELCMKPYEWFRTDFQLSCVINGYERAFQFRSLTFLSLYPILPWILPKIFKNETKHEPILIFFVRVTPVRISLVSFLNNVKRMGSFELLKIAIYLMMLNYFYIQFD